MIEISINLPLKKRLSLRVSQRRSSQGDPIVPKLEDIKRVKRGSKISRYFRHIFEHKNIRKLFGVNLAFVVLASSAIPTSSAINTDAAEQNVVVEENVVLSTTQSVQYPVNPVVISQGYRFYHPAIDFDGITGNPIKPIMAGRVEAISYSRYAYGNAVIVNHGSGLTSLYAHLSKIFVTKDQVVDLNTTVGEMGATGRAFGDHLHFEIRENGIAINPFSILPR